MKPHSRIRKTIKWGSAVVTVLLLAVWIGSIRWGGGWTSKRGLSVGFSSGLFCVTWRVDDSFVAYAGWHFVSLEPEIKWSIRVFGQGQRRFVQVPLWLPILLVAGTSLGLWYGEARTRRFARFGIMSCPKCNYDRAGIAGDARCPECGDLPA